MIRGLKGTDNVQLDVLLCDASLELIICDLIGASPTPCIQMAGFGTNILSAAAFLHSRSRPHGVSLCDKKLRGEYRGYGTFGLIALFVDVNCCANVMSVRRLITCLKRFVN